jgi:hypothetical protein
MQQFSTEMGKEIWGKSLEVVHLPRDEHGRLLHEDEPIDGSNHLQEMAKFPYTKAIEMFFYWFGNITGVQYVEYWKRIKSLGDEHHLPEDEKEGIKIVPLIPTDLEGNEITWKVWVYNILRGLYLKRTSAEILKGLRDTFASVFQVTPLDKKAVESIEIPPKEE